MSVKERLLFGFLVMTMVGVVGACAGSDGDDPDGGGDLRDGGETSQAVLQVTGMTCTGCTTRIRAALLALDGVVSAEVTLSPAEARIEYWPDEVTPQDMIDAIARIGYEAVVL